MNHGHVTPNTDGSKARCGGPGVCTECSLEARQKKTDKISKQKWNLPHETTEIMDKWVAMLSEAGGAPNILILLTRYQKVVRGIYDEHQPALAEKDKRIQELEAKLAQAVGGLEATDLHWFDGRDEDLACVTCDMGDAGRQQYSDRHDEGCPVSLAHSTLAALKSPAIVGKDGIGWCPNGLDDSPADDPWRK